MLKQFRQITTTLPLSEAPETGKLLKKLETLGSSDNENKRREQILCKVCPTLGPILELLRNSAPIGQVGDYNGVHRATPVYAGFTPIEGANPAKGRIGNAESVQLIQFQTWASSSVSRQKLSDFLSQLRLLHPYERPVIEVTKSEQWVDDKPKEKLKAILKVPPSGKQKPEVR